MQRVGSFVTASLLGIAAGHVVVQKGAQQRPMLVNAVPSVIGFLTNMSKAGEAEMHDEQKQYAAYAQFCTHTTEEKTKMINEAAQQINDLQVEINLSASMAVQHTDTRNNHGADVVKWTVKKENATELREQEKADFLKEQEDLVQSVLAITQAIDALRTNKNNAQVFAQLAASQVVPDSVKHYLELLASQTVEAGAPEVNAYEFQSGNILSMLETLRRKFQAQLTDTQAREDASLNAFNLLDKNLDDQIQQGHKDIARTDGMKTATLDKQKKDEEELSNIMKTKEADEGFLNVHTTTCAQKATDYEARQTLRAEEIDAIRKAIEILSAPEVLGTSQKHWGEFVQVGRMALAALRSMPGNEDTMLKARTFLEQKSRQLGSQLLVEVATTVRRDDPLAKVKNMIQDLVTKLLEQRNAEASDHAYCDEEMSKNSFTRDDKTAELQKLNATIGDLSDDIEDLTKTITTLTVSVAETKREMEEEAEFRAKEKATNDQTVKEAKEAQAATAQAVVVLRDFYAKAKGATALAQQRDQPVAPEIFEKPYRGMQTGAIGLLEIIMSDFAKLETESYAAETKAAEAFDKEMAASKTELAVQSKEIEHSTASKETKKTALASTHAEREVTQEYLDAANEEHEQLLTDCVETGSTFKERDDKRTEEIQALKEAVAMLKDA